MDWRNESICLITFTRNSAYELERLLRHTYNFVDEIVVVDGCSSDRTVEVAEKFGAKIFRRKAWGFVEPDRMFAINQCKSSWILYLDVDELPSISLLRDIKMITNKADAEGVAGFYIRRINLIKGEINLPLEYQLRLYRRDKVLYKGIVHEMPKIRGKISYLPETYFIIHLPRPELSRHLKKV